MSDDEYDRWCLRLAKRWDSLDPLLQWQLGSAEDIKSTGYHVKVTAASVAGAVAWLKAKGISFTYFGYKRDWHYSKKHQLRWLKVTDFAHYDHNPHEIVAKSRKSPKKPPISTQKPAKKRVKLSATYSSVGKKRAKLFFS